MRAHRHVALFGLTPSLPSGMIPAVQLQLRAYFLDPFKDFRYNVADSSLHMPLSSAYSQVLLISAYLSCVWLIRKHFNGYLKDSPSFLKLAVVHNLVLAVVSLVLLLLLSDQVSSSVRRCCRNQHVFNRISGLSIPPNCIVFSIISCFKFLPFRSGLCFETEGFILPSATRNRGTLVHDSALSLATNVGCRQLTLLIDTFVDNACALTDFCRCPSEDLLLEPNRQGRADKIPLPRQTTVDPCAQHFPSTCCAKKWTSASTSSP